MEKTLVVTEVKNVSQSFVNDEKYSNMVRWYQEIDASTYLFTYTDYSQFTYVINE